MKKKILCLMFVMVMCLSIFTGCSLVERDNEKYFESEVAHIDYVDGTKDVIKTNELLTAYSSYGYNYVKNYGYTVSKALDTTLETIINKRITIKSVEKYYKDANEELFNNNEKTYLWEKTYEAVYGNLESYYYDVIGYDGDKEEESASSNKSVFSDYNREYELVEENGKTVIKMSSPATTVRSTYQAREVDGEYIDYELVKDGKQIFKQMMYDKLVGLTKDGSADYKRWKNAYGKYILAVKKNYSYKNYTTDEEWFNLELDRIYNILKDNYLVEKYEIINNPSKQDGMVASNVSVGDVLTRYSAMVREDYNKYKNNKSTFESDILSSSKDVDYIWEGDDASNYFSVAYIKLTFKDGQDKEYSQINNISDSTGKVKEEKLNSLYNRVYVNVRDSKTGEETSEKVLAKDLLSAISGDVASVGSYDGMGDETIAIDKAEAFRKYLYLYNDDDTLKGADVNTVFGVDINGNVLANSTFSSNENVKKAIKSLYNDGNAKVGDLSDVVRADDGVYIFFYAGEVENLFNGIDINFDAKENVETIKALTTKRINIFSKKTVFDSIYDSLKSDNYSVFENMNINKLRNELVNGAPEKNENNLKDVIKNLSK